MLIVALEGGTRAGGSDEGSNANWYERYKAEHVREKEHAAQLAAMRARLPQEDSPAFPFGGMPWPYASTQPFVGGILGGPGDVDPFGAGGLVGGTHFQPPTYAPFAPPSLLDDQDMFGMPTHPRMAHPHVHPRFPSGFGNFPGDSRFL